MAATKERYQNPTTGDTVKLRLFSYNSNNLANLTVEKVEIYVLDPTEKCEANPDGRRLVQTFDGSSVVQEDTGTYLLEVEMTDPLYLLGTYKDVWTLAIDNQPAQTAEQVFEVYPQLWYTTPIPVVYDFSFHFQPNKLRQGSIQYLIIEIVPNVPRSRDLRQYYENLAIVSDLQISIEQACGPCVPEEADLRLLVDDEPVDYREKRFGYYKLDTTDMDEGIYNVWFKLNLGENVYVSEKMQLQIFN